MSSSFDSNPRATNRRRDPGPAPAEATRPAGDAGAITALDRTHRVLIETARQLGSSLEPEPIFARMIESVRAVMPCDGLIVSSFDRHENLIRCAFAWVGGNVLDPAGLPPLKYKADSEGMQTQVIRTGRPMRFSDVAERVRDPKGTYYEVDPAGGVKDLKGGGPTSSRSAAMVPLRLGDEVVGVVQVMADVEGAYSETDLELLEAIALLLAVALENARLYRRAQDELEERRRAEAELRRTEEMLREADRRKDEFLATLGHELRNPLNPIRSSVELLRRKDTSDPDVRWNQDMIERQVIHLTRLIDDLLDIGRITQGKIELRRSPLELHEILSNAVDAMLPIIEGSGQRLMVQRSPKPIRVNADPVRLVQVFSNLLDNASKYAGAKGSIDVGVEPQGDHALITVKDDGAGIAPEHLPHIFDLFYQAERSFGRTHGGLGIGLTLAKRLVEMHDGTIEAASDGLGRGTRFMVRLPILAAAAAAAAAGRAGEARSLRPMRILVADDNRDSADSMAMLLRLNGNEVRVAYDGEDAVQLADEFRPEVLLLDIGMPRLNGYEVAQRLRSREWGQETVLIAATGWGQEEDRRRSMETGFNAHLVKPVDHATLMRLLGELLP